jgi:Ca2+-binding EF-hand superfamily protein
MWHYNRIDEEKKGVITFNDYFNHFFGNRARNSMKNLGKDDDEDELIDI